MGFISPAASSTPSASKIDFWNMNIPESEWTSECPAFLERTNPKDVQILLTPQAEYKLMTWDTLSQHVANNRLDVFQRTPLDLRKYLDFNYQIRRQYGSVMNFIQNEKLKWPSPIVAKGKAFEYEEDICVQFNDWPYGIEKEVVHLVVWTKFPLEEAGNAGDLSDAERRRIDKFVDQRFRKPLGAENVLWFRNWAALKSVHSIEHFHVMLRNPSSEFLDDVVGGSSVTFKRDDARDQEPGDEDVSLCKLFPEQARRQQDNAARPMGLMEKRELEDSEPLTNRKERLLDNQPLMRAAVLNRASTTNFPTSNNSTETTTTNASVSPVNLLGSSDPVSGTFSEELINRFGTPSPKIEATPDVSEDEETLGQRRRRLIAEKDAREKEVRSGTPDPDSQARPIIKQRRSMADILQAHPARAPSPGIPKQRPDLNRRRSSSQGGLSVRPSAQHRLASMNRRSSANLAPPPRPPHSRTHSTEFPHLAAIEKERKQKAQIAHMQAEVQAQQHLQHTTMRGMGLLGSQYAGSGLNVGMARGSDVGSLGVPPLMAGMVGPNGGIMAASPGPTSTVSGYFGNKEMVDRMIAMRLATQAALRPGQTAQAAGGFVPPPQGTGLGLNLNQSVGTGSNGLGSQGPMGGQRGMGKMGLGRGMGPQNHGEWRNQQAQWAHWARLQGLGMGLGGNGIGGKVGTNEGGVGMVEAWRRGVDGMGPPAHAAAGMQ